MSRAIENILKNVEATTINIGSHKGHFISTAEVNAIRRELPISVVTTDGLRLNFEPATPVALQPPQQLLDDIAGLQATISEKQAELATAKPSAALSLSAEIQDLDKGLRQLERALRNLRV